MGQPFSRNFQDSRRCLVRLAKEKPEQKKILLIKKKAIIRSLVVPPGCEGWGDFAQCSVIQAFSAISQIILPSGTLYALSLCTGADHLTSQRDQLKATGPAETTAGFFV